ncbi:transposase [Streptomyces sp. BE20]|uniref:transposase n=1 Tax=Streptomyces sp. BE20 TaxID=3002525 RepID=UPI002E78A45F|nr:transposase [Streptomyces sp. BE20]MEE1824865.1 transposase [Streptomyces sp. BE20]
MRQRPVRPADVRRADPGFDVPPRASHDRAHRSAHRHRPVLGRPGRSPDLRASGHDHVPGHPAPYLTVRRVTDWIMRRPERLDDTERKCLDELCERSPALATTTQYARRLATMVRERRSEHLALDVWLADVRLDGQPELRSLAGGIRRDHAAVLAALNTTLTSGAVEGNVTRIKLLKRQMYGRANFDLLRRRILLSP